MPKLRPEAEKHRRSACYTQSRVNAGGSDLSGYADPILHPQLLSNPIPGACAGWAGGGLDGGSAAAA